MHDICTSIHLLHPHAYKVIGSTHDFKRRPSSLCRSRHQKSVVDNSSKNDVTFVSCRLLIIKIWIANNIEPFSIKTLSLSPSRCLYSQRKLLLAVFLRSLALHLSCNTFKAKISQMLQDLPNVANVSFLSPCDLLEQIHTQRNQILFNADLLKFEWINYSGYCLK